MTGRFNVVDFRLAETLLCGQAFRWTAGADGFHTGVIGRRVVRLRQVGESVEWETVAPGGTPDDPASAPPPWLLHYLSEGTVPDLPWDDYDYDADEDATPEDVYDAIYARLERTR